MLHGIGLDCGGDCTVAKHTGKAELLADRIQVPSDALGGFKLSLFGKNRLLLENHRGIASYGTELIEIGTGSAKLAVHGQNLRIAAMDKRDMLISGRIQALEFE